LIGCKATLEFTIYHLQFTVSLLKSYIELRTKKDRAEKKIKLLTIPIIKKQANKEKLLC